MKRILACFITLLFFSCTEEKSSSMEELTLGSPFIKGKKEFLDTPFVTAGDRVYLVGNQDGSFPEIGWHIDKEMGGVWNHPIKLMDGFQIQLSQGETSLFLDKADEFTNFPYTNRHKYHFDEQKLLVNRWQFVPDGKQGLIVFIEFENLDDSDKDYTMRFVGDVDLLPTWLGDRTGMIDATDSAYFNSNSDVWVAKDTKNPWFTIFGSDQQSIAKGEMETIYQGKGVRRFLDYKIHLKAREKKRIHFVLAGSYKSEEEALSTYHEIHANFEIDLQKKKSRYEQLANQSKLTIEDKELQTAFEWLKYNSDWLVRSVPEIGTGITAGIPDYPWWFGVDSEYALKGYMAVGQTEAVYKTISLIDSLSRAVNGNGKIIHEASTNGAVFNPGNINETPQFASLIWEIYQWNGDRKFLSKYFPEIEKGLHWLLAENDANKNLFPDGFGMMEIHGLDSEMIDVAAYTQRAFDDASKMAGILGKEDLSKQYKEIANTLKKQINEEFWAEDFGSYADFIGSDQQAIHLIDDAIVRADTLNKPWAVKELEATRSSILSNPSIKPRPFVLHHNWVVNTPMEMKIADSAKALIALTTAEKFVNPFGVFVTGIDRDDSAGSDDGSFKGSKVFSYTGAVMTLPTGVLAVAENNYGRPDMALNYLERMTRTFSFALPGSMYEVSPDYGMMTQAWNIYSYSIPIVQQFFGIQPDAASKKVIIRPQMPRSWTNVSLENVQIADNEISVYYKIQNDELTIKVLQKNPEWELELQLDSWSFDRDISVLSSTIPGETTGRVQKFSSKGAKIQIIVQLN